MATNADFDALIVRITTATNTLETDVATITAGADNVQESVAAAQLAEANAEAAAIDAAGQVTLAADQVALAATQANTASSAATTATTQADRAQAIADDLLASAPFQEAPEDSQTYGRNNGDWVVVTSGGGGGAVDSVNGQTGVVVLDAADVGAKDAAYVPTWTEVTGKPSTFAPSAHVHSASDVNSGTFDVARIPDLAASKVTSGTFDDARIPTLDAAKIGTGVVAPARLGTGTPTASTVLLGNGTWGSAPASALGFPISETVNYNGSAMLNWPNANPNDSINGELLSSGGFTGIVAMIQSGNSTVRNSIPCGSYTFTTSLSTANIPAGGQGPGGGVGIIQVFHRAGANKNFVATSFDAFAAPDFGVMSIWKTNYWTRVGF